ncbi:hypothetical protein EYF80_033882 [Liparis tanakae]|uniref:Uncharacterized protein n=1 Tax=Liparis tanakae TaxID=230148 RepID=A0A4Z2GSX0_9TELE|nr:hypothetical protein EYF80_033882 [Liparis tanakae]
MAMRPLLSASVHKHRLQEDGGPTRGEGRAKTRVSAHRDGLTVRVKSGLELFSVQRCACHAPAITHKDAEIKILGAVLPVG